MFRILVSNQRQRLQLESCAGPLEFGRGPQRDVQRCVVDDPGVSRDHFRVTATADDRIEVANLSRNVPLLLADGNQIPPGKTTELTLPARLTVGGTLIEFSPQSSRADGRKSLQTVQAPHQAGAAVPSLSELFGASATPDAATLAHWFETVIAVQRSAASSSEFYEQTARAVVELIGLDCGMVLLHEATGWRTIAEYQRQPDDELSFSRQILGYVLEDGRTFFEDVSRMASSASLLEVSAAVASPIFGAKSDEVVGAVYGSRLQRSGTASAAIRPLEAQLVQALAAAVGAGLARAEHEADAARRRVLFEQFFSPQLSQELDRNPQLLDGRDREGSGVAYLDLGWTLNEQLLIGGELNLWRRTVGLDAGVEATVHLYNLSGTLTYYPRPRSGFFIKGGAGASLLDADVESLGSSFAVEGTGFGFIVGAGYDISFGRTVSLTPAVNFWYGQPGDLQVVGGSPIVDWKHNVIDFTIGMTFH